MYRTFIGTAALAMVLSAAAQAGVYEINIHPTGPTRGNEQFNCSDGQVCTGPQMLVNGHMLETQATVSPFGVTLQFFQSGLIVPVKLVGKNDMGSNTLVVPADEMYGSSPVRKTVTLTSPNVKNQPNYSRNPAELAYTGRTRAVDIQATIRRVAP